MGITVTGHGTASAIADEAVVTFDIAMRAQTAVDALDRLADVMTAVMAALDDGPATGHATAGLSLATEQDREGRVRGHRAAQQLTVVAPMEVIGRVLTDVVAVGTDAVAVRSLQQRASTHDELMERARESAVADARARATQHARLVGRQLGALLDLVEDERHDPSPRPMMRAMAEAMPVAAGEDDVSVTVTTTWSLD